MAFRGKMKERSLGGEMMSENCFFCENWSHSGFCIVKNIYTKFFEKCDDFCKRCDMNE